MPRRCFCCTGFDSQSVMRIKSIENSPRVYYLHNDTATRIQRQFRVHGVEIVERIGDALC